MSSSHTDGLCCHRQPLQSPSRVKVLVIIKKEDIGAYRGGKQNITEVVYLNRQEEKCAAVGTPEPSVESR